MASGETFTDGLKIIWRCTKEPVHEFLDANGTDMYCASSVVYAMVRLLAKPTDALWFDVFKDFAHIQVGIGMGINRWWSWTAVGGLIIVELLAALVINK